MKEVGKEEGKEGVPANRPLNRKIGKRGVAANRPSIYKGANRYEEFADVAQIKNKSVRGLLKKRAK